MSDSARDEFDELDDFNERVAQGSFGHGPRTGRTQAVPTAASEHDEGSEGAPQVKDARMWALRGPNYFPCDKAVDRLRPGQYEVQHSAASGYFFVQKEASFDELMRLPDSASDEIINNIEAFWTKEEHFRSFGFLWKRGILLWGPAGSGKTCTLQLVSNNVVKKGGISVYVSNPLITAHGLEIFRRIEPDRPCVVMLEDLDALISNHGESEVLALLDGELQIDNVVFIATTNYPERLDKRLVNRPSRFDIVKLIDMPKEDARRVYLANKNKRLASNPEELEMWVKKTDGFSIAHLKELIVSVEVFEVSFEHASKRLQKMSSVRPKSTDTNPSTGTYQ